MIFKNVIITCLPQDYRDVQKYLFRLGYSWVENYQAFHSMSPYQCRHRQVKRSKDVVYLQIDNDSVFHYALEHNISN